MSIAASSSSFAIAQASSSSSMSSAVAAPVSAGPSASDQVMHKIHLQEHAQKSNIALPIYQTVNEGFPHSSQFRSTVWVDGKCFTSPNVFPVRKAAEQDVAKLALESISSKVKDEELPVVLEQTMFCKCILNGFAAKMNLDKVTYETVKPEGSSAFVSSLVFNGKHYIGDPAKSKKEAEQLAARAAIISNLGNPEYGTRLSETIKSKYKFCAAIFNMKDCSKTVSTSTGHDPVIAAPLATNDVAPANAAPLAAKMSITPVTAASVAANINEMQVVVPESSSRVLQPQQKFEMPQQEIAPEDPKLLNVPLQACAQPSSSSSKKRKKNKTASENKKPILNTLHILEKKIKKRKEISEMKQAQGGKCQFCIHGQGHCFWELFKLKPSPKYLDTFENYERWVSQRIGRRHAQCFNQSTSLGANTFLWYIPFYGM